MKTTYNGRRVYDKTDISNAADIIRQALEVAGKGKGYYTAKEVNAAARMLSDIADNLGEDDGIICDGFAATIEYGV